MIGWSGGFMQEPGTLKPKIKPKEDGAAEEGGDIEEATSLTKAAAAQSSQEAEGEHGGGSESESEDEGGAAVDEGEFYVFVPHDPEGEDLATIKKMEDAGNEGYGVKVQSEQNNRMQSITKVLAHYQAEVGALGQHRLSLGEMCMHDAIVLSLTRMNESSSA